MIDPKDRHAARMARLTAMGAADTTPSTPAPEKATTAPRKATKEPRKATKEPKKATKPTDTSAEASDKPGRGTRPGGPPPGTAWLGTYLPRELIEAMRDAYVWELDHTDDPTTSLPRWIGRAILTHAQRTPQERAALAEARPDAEVPGLAGNKRGSYTVPQEALDALKAMEQADREAGVSTVKNTHVAAAVWAAVEATRTQAGGVLPHYTGRMPSKPNPASRG